VISPSGCLSEALAGVLPEDRFVVAAATPGSGVMATVRRERPHVAIVDRIDERPQAAPLEIAALKELCPDARIIVLSVRSSDEDAKVVEQGIFYYMAAPQVSDLVRVIHAAASAARQMELTR